MKAMVIGPRGGLSVTDITCDTCVCARKCAYSGPSRMGCLDWVSPAGQRWYSFSTNGVPENMEAAIPLQRLEHVREEVEEGRLAPADICVEDAEATMEPDPVKETGHDD